MSYVSVTQDNTGAWVPALATADGQTTFVGKPQPSRHDALTVARGALMLERMAEAFERLLAQR